MIMAKGGRKGRGNLFARIREILFEVWLFDQEGAALCGFLYICHPDHFRDPIPGCRLFFRLRIRFFPKIPKETFHSLFPSRRVRLLFSISKITIGILRENLYSIFKEGKYLRVSLCQ